MTNFLLLLKKDLWESWSSSKIAVTLTIFALISIGAPFLQYQNIISAGGITSGALTSSELLFEFYYTYVGILLVVLIPFLVMGVVAGEIKNNTAASLLVKPIGRAGYILSKFIVYFLLFGLAVTIAILLSAVYANTLAFEPIGFDVILAVLGGILVFVAFAVALLLFLSTIIRNQIVAGAIGLSTLVVLFVTGRLLQPLFALMPGKILAWAAEKVQLAMYPPDLIEAAHSPVLSAVAVSIVLTAVFVLVSIWTIKRKEL